MEEKKDWKELLHKSLRSMQLGFSGSQVDWIDNFVESVEQEAERRGALSLYKELDDLDIMLAMLHSVEDINDEEVHKIVGNIRNELKKTLDKLKLLEEENGKQNAR